MEIIQVLKKDDRKNEKDTRIQGLIAKESSEPGDMTVTHNAFIVLTRARIITVEVLKFQFDEFQEFSLNEFVDENVVRCNACLATVHPLTPIKILITPISLILV